MTATIGEIFSALLILSGTVVCLLSALGLIRFPDMYTRSHAASKTTTLGVMFILTGAFFYFWLVDNFISIRLLLGIFFVFLTAPVGAHLICRAAYRSGMTTPSENIRQKQEYHES